MMTFPSRSSLNIVRSASRAVKSYSIIQSERVLWKQYAESRNPYKLRANLATKPCGASYPGGS
eukprot:675348-Rhodomonas_salina.1